SGLSSAVGEAVASALAGAAGAALAALVDTGRPASGCTGLPWASKRGCDNNFARSSVTTMSPRSTVWSPPCCNASAQDWPGARQLQAALDGLRELKAVGRAA